MGKAELKYLLDNMTDALDAPDEHFDCIHMLSDNEWTTLEAELSTRPPSWRESLAYVLAEGPTDQALPLLSVLLRDGDANVAQQAALSLVDQAQNSEAVISQDDLRVMHQVAASTADGVDDLRAFLQTLMS